MKFCLKQFFYLILILFCNNLFADELIVEPDMGRAPVISAIDHAKNEVDLVMYGFTDKILLDTLIQQKLKNRTVKIILEEKPYKAELQNERALNLIKQYNINWRGRIRNFRLVHEKTLLLDHKQALVMTFNFTKSSFKNQRNFALLIDNPEEIREISRVFSADFNNVPIVPNEKHLIFSPDNSRERIIQLIRQATSSIHIYAQDFNDYQLVGAIATAAKKGIDVKLLLSKPLRERQSNYLNRAGVKITVSSQLYIHAKVIMIDEKRALLGSINFTKSSLDHNRELSVIIDDPKLIQKLSKFFDQDWQNTADTFKQNLINPKIIKSLVKTFMHFLSH